jgi:hypothetical protein
MYLLAASVQRDLVIHASPLDLTDCTNDFSYGEIRTPRPMPANAGDKQGAGGNGENSNKVEDSILCAQFKCRWSR